MMPTSIPNPASNREPIYLATRGSALALAQANAVLAECRQAFPQLKFELRIFKTIGDKLQTASLAQDGVKLPKGLFTKELEVALLDREADLAVHSLKDLPTELPSGLKLGAVCPRADVRDVLIYRAAHGPLARPGGRGFTPGFTIRDLPEGAVVGTSSTRRKAQLLAHRADLKTVEWRGNVATRLQKLSARNDVDATILAAAGLKRLHYDIGRDGKLTGEDVPDGLLATFLDPSVMLPCVGQGAIGIEIREQDKRLDAICERLNFFESCQCVLAERAFLAGMGGGCQSPVAAHAEVIGGELRMHATSFQSNPVRRACGRLPLEEATALGQQLAAMLR